MLLPWNDIRHRAIAFGKERRGKTRPEGEEL